jgi:aspartate aminotransferase-like enzyme
LTALKPAQFLMIPGPTPVPPVILEMLARHPIGHRSTEFSAIVSEATKGLKELGETESDAFILTGSGTMAMEAAISNTISPGDKVLCLVTGVFGERWAKIAQAFGAEVEKLESMAGTPVDVSQLANRLAKDKDQSIKAVTVTHNETSTGVLNELRQITHLIRKHGALSLVDAVTSFGAVRVPIDEWLIDVLITGSQKALMLPPGLSIIFFGERAWVAQATSKSPKFYIDLARYKKSISANTTPFTPNVSFICALHRALEMIKEESISKIQTRHLTLKTMLRAGLRSMGLKLFVDDECASPTITAILPPGKLTVAEIRKGLKDDYNIIVADGQEDLQGKIFRIGHMGYVFERDILMTLSCLDAVLMKLGHASLSELPLSAALQATSKKRS